MGALQPSLIVKSLKLLNLFFSESLHGRLTIYFFGESVTTSAIYLLEPGDTSCSLSASVESLSLVTFLFIIRKKMKDNTFSHMKCFARQIHQGQRHK